ncbi:adenylyl-sulfate kinase [Vallicoccus soli]|uniref:Adenylyl-sulfate kinase n=1 Tax=Vallicoccus soli TaxID=2339232 RepID=A0A3A3Z4Q0_9ACTN|nr:adenylyl-sulfate kinase [Vallicoccus soli]
MPVAVPDPAGLADVELLLSGALAPLTGPLDAAARAAVEAGGALPDGTPWPVALALELPEAEAEAARAAGAVVLADTESVPVALLRVAEAAPGRRPGRLALAGGLTALGRRSEGPFAALHRSPGAVRAGLPEGPVLAALVDRPPLAADVAALRAAVAPGGPAAGAHLLLLVRTADAGPDGLPADVLVRTVLAALPDLPAATVVTVPLAHRTGPAGPAEDLALGAQVAAAHGATHLLGGAGAAGSPLAAVPAPSGAPGPAQLRAALDAGALGAADATPGVARELARWRPPPPRRGVVVLLSGLSGSGKSTVARRVAERLVEGSDRRVSLLDGDEVRHVLSSGLGFSKADRDTNVRRIGWVAAEVARHGGIALCAPIAPYASVRAEVRAMAEAVGDFVLVHVATPLEVCEARDRKGLYAKARAGLIPAFTGVSDPYEAPEDAELVLDTSQGPVDDAAGAVLALLEGRGYLATPED